MPQLPPRPHLAEHPDKIQTREDFGSALVALLEKVNLTLTALAEHSRRRRDDNPVLAYNTMRGWLNGNSFGT
jgi:hypothetical protein